ncbi:hypothetical protein C8R47DRAFT_1054645 [Mycena vitilis]|nr:hypothetical protein C8R47DRAFT_1054645 [Mycena vitilis]
MPFKDLTRQEIIDLLALMGVELPPRTKLTDDKLYKRLGHVLDSCQYISRVVSDPPLIPTSYPLWRGGKTSLPEAVIRTNADEANRNERDIAMHTNAFRDLRHSLSDIALRVGEGYLKFAFQDPQMTSDIKLKVVEVRAFDSSTPIFLVQYKHYVRKAPLKVWADAMLPTTLDEQHLLLRLLRKNSKRIDPTYQPEGLLRDEPFKLSFLLPIGPLTSKDRGKHNTIEGCPNCGDSAPDLKKCSRCLSVSYCSKECQANDWKAHRSVCKSIDSGNWRAITFRRPPGFSLNRYEVIGHPEIYTRSLEYLNTSPPENAHGSQPFIVKIQLARANNNASNFSAAIGQTVGPPERSGQSISIYDRQMSMEVELRKGSADAGDFAAVAGLVGSKGFKGLRLFCWARRLADWTLELCLDHLPEEQKW